MDVLGKAHVSIEEGNLNARQRIGITDVFEDVLNDTNVLDLAVVLEMASKLGLVDELDSSIKLDVIEMLYVLSTANIVDQTKVLYWPLPLGSVGVFDGSVIIRLANGLSAAVIAPDAG